MTAPVEPVAKSAKAAGGMMGKQVGPLPMGAWALVVGGALFYSFYMSKKKTASTGTTDTTTPSALIYTGTGGGTPTDTTTPTTTTGYLTNEAWASAAKTFLISQSVDAKEASDAIDLYINAQALNSKQTSYVSIATKQLGPPPQSLPPVVGTPTPEQNPVPTYTSVWGDTPYSGGGLQGMWYTVKAGEKLPDLAKRAYGLAPGDYSGLELAMSEIVDRNAERITNINALPTDTQIYIPIIGTQEFPTGYSNHIPIVGYDPNKPGSSGDPFVDAGMIPKSGLVRR